ncbi:MAG: hypothetical protein AAF530_12465 [Pseudomonadota bacterium]
MRLDHAGVGGDSVLRQPHEGHAGRQQNAGMGAAKPMGLAQNLGHSNTPSVETHDGHLADKFKSDMIGATAPTFDIETEKVCQLGKIGPPSG